MKFNICGSHVYIVFIIILLISFVKSSLSQDCSTFKDDQVIVESYTGVLVPVYNAGCRIESTGYMSYGFWFVWIQIGSLTFYNCDVSNGTLIGDKSVTLKLTRSASNAIYRRALAYLISKRRVSENISDDDMKIIEYYIAKIQCDLNIGDVVSIEEVNKKISVRLNGVEMNKIDSDSAPDDLASKLYSSMHKEYYNTFNC
jgi:hypothetical protein